MTAHPNHAIYNGPGAIILPALLEREQGRSADPYEVPSPLLAEYYMELCSAARDFISLLETGVSCFSESHFCRLLRCAEEVPSPMPLPAFKMTKLILTRDRGAQGASDAEKTHELEHEGEATPTRNG